MVKWFGEPWGAEVCETGERVRTPIGGVCPECVGMITLGDQGVLIERLDNGFGVPWHLSCFLTAMGLPEVRDVEQ
jgi:hypothetical protein